MRLVRLSVILCLFVGSPLCAQLFYNTVQHGSDGWSQRSTTAESAFRISSRRASDGRQWSWHAGPESGGLTANAEAHLTRDIDLSNISLQNAQLFVVYSVDNDNGGESPDDVVSLTVYDGSDNACARVVNPYYEDDLGQRYIFVSLANCYAGWAQIDIGYKTVVGPWPAGTSESEKHYSEGMYIDYISLYADTTSTTHRGSVFYDDVEADASSWTDGYDRPIPPYANNARTFHVSTRRAFGGAHSWFCGPEVGYAIDLDGDTPGPYGRIETPIIDLRLANAPALQYRMTWLVDNDAERDLSPDADLDYLWVWARDATSGVHCADSGMMRLDGSNPDPMIGDWWNNTLNLTGVSATGSKSVLKFAVRSASSIR